jgi:hypothetical protein
MHDGQSSLFRGTNPSPVWLDYGAGAVRVVVDGTTEATYLRVESSGSEPSYINPLATFPDQVFFYIEITSGLVRCWQKHSEPPADYSAILDRQSEHEFPLLLMESDMLYIGRSSSLPFAGTYMQGTIEDIHIYDRHLTEAELNIFKSMNSKKVN